MAVRNGPLMAVLAALSAVAPFSVDVYTPSLPRIQQDLGGADWVIQASITAGLLGIGVGQLVFGPVSDRVGRRPVILLGTVGFSAASMVSAVATSPWLLVAARLATGLSGSAGIVAARSVVRDVSPVPELVGGRIALLSMVSAAAPVVAPAVGAGIAARWSWRADFAALVVLGAVIAVAAARWVPETLPRTERHASPPVLAALGRAVADRELRNLSLALAIQAFGFYAYVASMAFIVERQLGHGPAVFAMVFSANAMTMLLANVLFRRQVRTVHPSVLLGRGLAAAGLAGAILAVTAALDGPVWILWGSTTLFAAAIGFVLPGAHSWGQLTRTPSGAASALTGSAQFSGGVLGAPATGLIGPTALLLGTIIAVTGASALVPWRVASREAAAR